MSTTPPVPPQQPASPAATRGRLPVWAWITIGAGVVVVIAAIIVTIVLVSSATSGPRMDDADDLPPLPSASATTAPTEEPETPSVPDAGDGTVPTEATAPGTTLAQGAWANIPFTTYSDKASAAFAATVTSITKAPEADVAGYRADDPQLAAYDVYYIMIDLKKISGPELEYESLEVGFRPIDASGTVTSELSLIGSDSCPNLELREGFDTSGETFPMCVASLVPAGGSAPAGAHYGPYKTPYDRDAGKPITWMAR